MLLCRSHSVFRIFRVSNIFGVVEVGRNSLVVRSRKYKG